jgi:hypothetical protein
VIAWNPPVGGTPPVAYAIYRNADLTKRIATIKADQKLKFKDHNRKKRHTYSYFLVSVDEFGNQSLPIGIIFKGRKTRLVKVPSARLVAIEVEPINPFLADGFTLQFRATGLFSNDTTQDLTHQVTWSSSDPHIATISNHKGSHGLAAGVSPGTVLIEATLDGVTGSTTLTVTAAHLVSIEIDPANAQVADGFTIAFTAIGHFSDGTIENLTNGVVWESSQPDVASISPAGVATGKSAGTTAITATSHGVTGSDSLTVTPAHLVSITVTPVDPALAVNFKTQFKAEGLFSDETTEDLTNSVTWTSSDPTVATITNSGLATALHDGFTTITATSHGISGSTILTVTAATLVSIDVIETEPAVAGFTTQFLAIGHFSDGTTEDLTNTVTWESSNPDVAMISNESGQKGLASCLHTGNTIVTAAARAVRVERLVSVSDAALVTLKIAPTNSELAVGFTLQFTATGLFSDGSTKDLTTQVTWESSRPDFATVSNAPGSQGLVTALSTGGRIAGIRIVISATITHPPFIISAGTSLTVTPAVLTSIVVTPENITIPAGNPISFTATGIFSDGSKEDLTTQVAWESSDSAVAEISNVVGSQGVATGKTIGETVIKAAKGQIFGLAELKITCRPIAFTTTFLPQAHANEPYEFQLPTNGVQPVTFELVSGSLPIGFTLSPDGVIRGFSTVFRPNAIFSVKATSHCGTSTIGTFSLQVQCGINRFTAPNNNRFPDGTVGEKYSFQMAASGEQPIEFTAFTQPRSGQRIPPGLTLDSNGLLHGTPLEAGTFSFTVEAINHCSSRLEIFRITIKP